LMFSPARTETSQLKIRSKEKIVRMHSSLTESR
jgi:hypothetical protein